MSIEERFNAAVNVIKGLPKNGSYQPSNDMMLRFYSYFKQATQGPCKLKKPPFWDLVSRAKWDSWMSLRDMPSQRAMECYVDELKKIIETMSYTDNVAQFMGSISELDGINVDDLEAVAPEIMKKARSHPNSPFASREASPTRLSAVPNGFINRNGVLSSETSNENSSYIHQNGHTVDHSDDEYIDTVETRSDINFDSARDTMSVAVQQQILQSVQKMNTDLQQLVERITSLERNVLEMRNTQLKQRQIMKKKYPSWWPFEDISPTWFVILVLWPFLVQRFGKALQRRK